ncbi:hypothetical protein GUJ93_ZPchr0013g35094 [Zizania palustris]|uniref:Uncharacterized protein n=1 Tax=Zizania palustris TaxID=103762 RepID=A0A8J6BXK9_ZIZPA|nr:hypothetical protein GUJ93_ZPchr0013g35094 [Zizania palustris]
MYLLAIDDRTVIASAPVVASPTSLEPTTACDVDEAPPAYTITLLLTQNLRCFSGCYTSSLLSLPGLGGHAVLAVATAASVTRHDELEAPSRSSSNQKPRRRKREIKPLLQIQKKNSKSQSWRKQCKGVGTFGDPIK